MLEESLSKEPQGGSISLSIARELVFSSLEYRMPKTVGAPTQFRGEKQDLRE